MLVLAEVVAGRHTSAARMLKEDCARPHEAGTVHAQSRRGAGAGCQEPVLCARRNRARRSRRCVIRLRRIRALRRKTSRASCSANRNRGRPSCLLRRNSGYRDLAAGLTPKHIAAEMGRSVYTVQTHIQNVIDKFGCHGRAEALAAARRIGLLNQGSNGSYLNFSRAFGRPAAIVWQRSPAGRLVLPMLTASILRSSSLRRTPPRLGN